MFVLSHIKFWGGLITPLKKVLKCVKNIEKVEEKKLKKTEKKLKTNFINQENIGKSWGKVAKKLENVGKSWKKLNKNWKNVDKKLRISFLIFSFQLITPIKCLKGLKFQKTLFLSKF